MSSHFKKIDWFLVAIVVALVSFGLISLYSTGGEELINFKKQILWAAIGFFAMFAISFFDYRSLKNNSSPVVVIYLASLAFLAGLLVFGTATRGAESWYRFGLITLEPVEIVKISVIILLAKYFSMRHVEIYNFKHIIVSGMYVLIPALIVFTQPDMGSAVVLIAIWFGIVVFAGVKLKQVAILALMGVVLFALMWSFFLADYQKDRLLSFRNPDLDPSGVGYNVRQSIIAIGSGGIFGNGLRQGTQSQLGFLPEAQTDFIYASITEELGILGAGFLIVCFWLLFKRIMDVSRNSSNNFARFVSAGFSIMIFSQVLINIGMNLGLLPITGLPLPFVSYGGSSLISFFIMLGVIQSIKIN